MTPYPGSPALGPSQIHLRILATSDLHMHVLPWDYCADRPHQGFGLAELADLIEAARAGAANSLLVDNGDLLQGTPMGDLMADQGRGAHDPHPMIAAMGRLGYDAATIGNHDFNFGVDFLLAALAGAAFPVVSANVATRIGASPRQDETLLPPWALLDRMLADGSGRRHRLRIGVIGLIPPQILVWDRDHLHGRVRTRDIVETAADQVPRLREAGADLVIALSHSGIGAASPGPGLENASLALAALPGIDAVVAGHSHQVFPSPAFEGRDGVDVPRGLLAGKPATMPGAFGSHLGLIDLVLAQGPTGWEVADGRGRVLPVPVPAPGGGGGASGARQAVAETVGPAHEATLAAVRRPVGASDIPLTTHFAMVAPVPAVALVARAKRRHVAEALRQTGFAGLPVLATAAPFKAGGRSGPDYYTDVPAGPLAERHVADLYAFPNTISAVIATGDDLRGWLERAAGAYRRIAPGAADQCLLDPDFSSHSFDMLFGLTYVIDLSQPARYSPQGDLLDASARRITGLWHEGRPVGPGDRFIVATNSYRAGGGSRFPGAGPDRIVYSAPLRNREILRRYLVALGTVRTGHWTPPVWRFAPMPGASVLFDTAPTAVVRPDDPAGLDIEPAGPGEAGFARYRIRL